MEFSAFLNQISKITKETLPGENAHFKMAPPERARLIKKLDPSDPAIRKAAVMMLVYPKDGDATLALILRNTYKGVHSSQIAFPGGKVESFDVSFEAAALRETNEEIGVPPEQINVVRSFSEIYIPPSKFRVFPFLGYCSNTPVFIPDPAEVAGIIEFSLEALLDEQTLVVNNMATSYSESVAVPTFKVGDRYVWGATAMMLSELKDVLKTVQ